MAERERESERENVSKGRVNKCEEKKKKRKTDEVKKQEIKGERRM